MRRSVIVLLSMLLVGVVAPAASAAVPEVLVADYGRGLTTVGLDGSDPTVVGPATTVAAFSPDGRQVAFVPSDVTGSGSFELHVARTDGGGERVLASGGGALNPLAWSPDGALIVGSREGEGPDENADNGVWTYDVATGEATRIHAGEPAPSGGRYGAFGFAWSPDGARIAFVRYDRSAGNAATQVVVVERSGGTFVPVTEVDGTAIRPSWSPAGDLLVFESLIDRYRPDLGGAIEVARPDGTDRSTLVDGFVFAPQWSPDGTTIAFTRDDELHLMAPDGSDVRRVLAAPEAVEGGDHTIDIMAGWSPDGNYLAFTRTACCTPGAYGGNPPTAQTVRVDGGELRRVGEQGSSELVAFAPPVPVAEPSLVNRIAGASREATAAALSAATVDAADAVVLARSDAYADALAGGPLAVDLDGSLLLTGSQGLHPDAAAEIRRLMPTTAYLLGGSVALSPQVEADLNALGVADVQRIAGTDRFDTARLVAERVGGDEAYVVEGANADPQRGWPDAVAAGSLAAAQGRPILLAQSSDLPAATVMALRGRTAVTIVGGQVAVDSSVEETIRGLGVETTRVAGRTRHETAVAVAALAAEGGRTRAARRSSAVAASPTPSRPARRSRARVGFCCSRRRASSPTPPRPRSGSATGPARSLQAGSPSSGVGRRSARP